MLQRYKKVHYLLLMHEKMPTRSFPQLRIQGQCVHTGSTKLGSVTRVYYYFFSLQPVKIFFIKQSEARKIFRYSSVKKEVIQYQNRIYLPFFINFINFEDTELKIKMQSDTRRRHWFWLKRKRKCFFLDFR